MDAENKQQKHTELQMLSIYQDRYIQGRLNFLKLADTHICSLQMSWHLSEDVRRRNSCITAAMWDSYFCGNFTTPGGPGTLGFGIYVRITAYSLLLRCKCIGRNPPLVHSHATRRTGLYSDVAAGVEEGGKVYPFVLRQFASKTQQLSDFSAQAKRQVDFKMCF